MMSIPFYVASVVMNLADAIAGTRERYPRHKHQKEDLLQCACPSKPSQHEH